MISCGSRDVLGGGWVCGMLGDGGCVAFRGTVGCTMIIDRVEVWRMDLNGPGEVFEEYRRHKEALCNGVPVTVGWGDRERGQVVASGSSLKSSMRMRVSGI